MTILPFQCESQYLERRESLTSITMGIPIIKVRYSHDHRTFSMWIPVPGGTGKSYQYHYGNPHYKD